MDTDSAFSLALTLILLSALLHALVNTLIKVSGDGLITRGCMNATACLAAAPLLLLVPLPSPELWPLLAVSVLIHALYPFFLIEAYRYGDLSTSFPLIRGSVPLLVTAFAAIALGQLPGTVTLAGIALVSAAVASFAWSRGSRSHRAHGRGIAFAFLTGLVVAAYTVIDAIGLSAAPTALAYIVWLFVLDGACVAALVAIARRGAVITFIARHWKISLVAGALGTFTYGLALFAFSLGPMAEISALRETSILFAALIGTLILKEPFGRGRAVAALVAVTGIVIIHAGR